MKQSPVATEGYRDLHEFVSYIVLEANQHVTTIGRTMENLNDAKGGHNYTHTNNITLQTLHQQITTQSIENRLQST